MGKVETFQMTPCFTVKTSEEEKPYIAAEPMAEGNAWPSAPLHQLTFGLPPGPTDEQAEAAAQWLNASIKSLTLTVFK
jgi:hypothetical protein